MDTSPEYIKMCEKAIKDITIMLFRKIGDYVSWNKGQLFIVINAYADDVNGIQIKRLSDGEEYDLGSRAVTPIFRQDQLQEMVIGEKEKFDNHIHAHNFFTDFVYDTCYDEIAEAYKDICPSMEQLWLAFVMKEKYNKIWDGEDWINAEN